METIEIVVCYNDKDKATGVMKLDTYKNRMPNKSWVRRIVVATVPKADWDNEVIRIDTVERYLERQEIQQLRQTLPWMGDSLAGLFGLNI